MSVSQKHGPDPVRVRRQGPTVAEFRGQVRLKTVPRGVPSVEQILVSLDDRLLKRPDALEEVVAFRFQGRPHDTVSDGFGDQRLGS